LNPRVKKVKEIDVQHIQSQIADLLKFSTYEPEYKFWLDTGSEELNRVFGSTKAGLPFGKIYELSGEEHSGKTVVGTVLAGMAQKSGAAVIYVDFEDSRDPVWANKLGLDWSKVTAFWPKLVVPKGGSKGIPRLQGAEEVMLEAELSMALLHKMGYQKIFLLVDSIANMQTLSQGEAGTANQTMRTRLDRAVVLSDILPRWCGLAANYNAMIFLLNQLREKVGMVFGDPTQTTGGRSLRHNCSVRAKIRRSKNGRMIQQKKVIGIKSVITNFKNKAGQGSVEGAQCGIKVRWDSDPAMLELLSVADLKAEEV
jgi:recombination protein RecA